jgi:mono/diheme cytochrome c family protein
MLRHILCLLTATMVAASLLLTEARAEDPHIQRGKYLVDIIGCSDCHTAGSFLGHPDITHYLGGSNVGFSIPNMGVFVGSNLTPDDATGLGKWSLAQIVTAVTTGVRPDGRMLAPIMPWRDFASLKPDDVQAIAMFLKSLPPVSNAVPGPFGPNDTPTVLVMTIVPGDVYARLPKGP